jgi:DNA (cytosine-5)-methyltransferase 1
VKLLSLFSGIGAFEKALKRQNIDFELVNYCEIDKFASKAYYLIHNENESKNLFDITKVNEKELPNFDLMTYGFPCQAFSIAGMRKGQDDRRGKLFFDAMRIAEYKKPKYMIAENVPGLLSIHNGEYFESVLLYLDSIGYNNYWQVLNAKDYGIPQNRERVFIVSIRKDIDDLSFEFPEKQELKIKLHDIIDINARKEHILSNRAIERINRKKGFLPQIEPEITGTINTKNNSGQLSIDNGTTLIKIIDERFKSRDKREYDCYSPSVTISSSDELKVKINNDVFRKLTPLECFRLMGFDDEDYYKLESISNTQKYKMAGNSIVVNVLEAIFKQLFFGDKSQKWLF